MLYNNLIYFLVVIFIFTTNTPAEKTWLPSYIGLPLFAVLLWWFSRTALKMYRQTGGIASAYFRAEKKLSLLGVALFVFSVYCFDLKYYVQPLSLAGKLPSLVNLAGLVLFFLILILMWLRAKRAYQLVFNRPYTYTGFLLSNIKANLPIILPWLVLSVVFDLLSLLPIPGVQQLLGSPWGDLVLFSVFVFFLALFFPPLVKWLWGCKPLPEGPLRDRIVAFCKTQNFHSDILSWPLFEGQVLTAGIMGIVPKLRYLLLTPALLATLNEEELNSVLAHEIGHVKKMHLVLYILLFLGFSVLAGALAEPIPYIILTSDLFYQLLGWWDLSPETLLGVMGAMPLLVLLLIYFRFIFGYFIRNFERQADLYVFKAQGTSDPINSSFEKIARLSGNRREEKSWHHFGIGERIAFLEKCEVDRSLIRRHDRKVHWSLLTYCLCITLLVFSVRQIEVNQISGEHEAKYREAVILQKARQDPGNSLWHILLGELMLSRQMEQKAVEAYEKALELSPMNGEVNNNLAWLLLTAKDTSLRDADRALTLALMAVMQKEQGYNLDTLATAYWANGNIEEALSTEARAAKLDPVNGKYYRAQMLRFQYENWQDDG